MARWSLLIAAAVVSLPTTSFVSTASFAAERIFEADLDPVPFDATNRAEVIASRGAVEATLDGHTLKVTGRFSDMRTPATNASLRFGLAKGVPGDAIGPLNVPHGKEGTILGSIVLNDAQLSALETQSIYVRIDSEKAVDGNLQGWLEPKGK